MRENTIVCVQVAALCRVRPRGPGICPHGKNMQPRRTTRLLCLQPEQKSRRFNEFPASMKKKIRGGETFFDKSRHKNATAVAGSQKRRGAAAFLKADQNGHSLH